MSKKRHKLEILLARLEDNIECGAGTGAVVMLQGTRWEISLPNES
ncbi:TPA: hypothetical protein ACF63W_001447 [Salmonella enterica]|nr:hypothetical protein [Salmonella enterica]